MAGVQESKHPRMRDKKDGKGKLGREHGARFLCPSSVSESGKPSAAPKAMAEQMLLEEVTPCDKVEQWRSLMVWSSHNVKGQVPRDNVMQWVQVCMHLLG